VTRTSVSSFLLPRRSEIEAASRTLYELLETSVSVPASPASERARQAGLEANISEASRRLGAMLLDPIRSLLTRKRIAVVADGILQYIPFAAFPEGTDNVGKASGWQPLFVKHEVVMLPSWSILAVLRSESREHPPTQKTVAVLADPVFDKDDPRVRAARRGSYPPPPQSVERRGLIRRGRELLRAAQNLDGDERPVSFQRLPFSTQEAQAIFRVVPQDETMRALGFDASLKTALDPELRNYRIIHYATHGLLNNAYPELSGIVLSLVDKWGRPEDGFLRLNEIYNLDLSADLVVMSACRTGLGKDAWGEGLIGLTRGFMYAGVPRVVASLWQIDDRATAEFMRYFYEAMFVEHLVPAAALRAAQIRMWQVVEWRFPHYWAAFVLQGEWN
jgi:CHAT domain-containing protein